MVIVIDNIEKRAISLIGLHYILTLLGKTSNPATKYLYCLWIWEVLPNCNTFQTWQTVTWTQRLALSCDWWRSRHIYIVGLQSTKSLSLRPTVTVGQTLHTITTLTNNNITTAEYKSLLMMVRRNWWWKWWWSTNVVSPFDFLCFSCRPKCIQLL